MHEILKRLESFGVIPVIKLDDPDQAVPLARALMAGGLPCAEVTFRTAAGEEAIRRIHAETPEVLVGAGTVLTPEQVDKAVAAGAAFIVSPGFNPRVVARCQERGVPVTPGCSTPSDMERALEAGLDVVKFFPAEQSGGVEYIKAVAAPYHTLRFIPTGGVGPHNIAAYTANEKILACGGSWMVPQDALRTGDFAAITVLCRQAFLAMLNLRVVHLGINAAAEPEAAGAAHFFQSVFGLPSKVGASSIFASDAIEIMKTPGPGARGHIAIGTTSVLKAAAFLERQGVAINKDSVKTAPSGAWTVAYLAGETLGFALHLVYKP